VQHALLSLLTATPTPSPSPSPSPAPSVSATAVADRLNQAVQSVQCTRDDVSICGLTYRVTGNERLGKTLEVLLGTPLRILLIILVGLLVRRVAHRLINRLADRIARGPDGGLADRGAVGALLSSSPLLTTRREQRARTLASVLRSITTGLVGTVVLLMVLQELDFSVAPLLASASVVGVAIGFGAQSLVRDVVSGIFMIIEDQYGVGDVIDAGSASGTVEEVGLRITRLRDLDGTVWYVRNGEILRVGNRSQGWARAVIDVAVGYGEDLDRVQDLLLRIGHDLRSDADYGPRILDEPEVWGVEALNADSVVVRLVVKTQPLQQWNVGRELRHRIKIGFDRAGIPLPAQPRTVVPSPQETRDDGRAEDQSANHAAEDETSEDGSSATRAGRQT